MEEERGKKGGSSNPRHRYHLGARELTFFISYEVFGNVKKPLSVYTIYKKKKKTATHKNRKDTNLHLFANSNSINSFLMIIQK